MPRCTECLSSFTSFNFLLIHMKENHDFKNLKIFRCQESNCYRSFSSWKSFDRHFIENHEAKINLHKKVSSKKSRNATNSQSLQDYPINSTKQTASITLAVPQNYLSRLREIGVEPQVEDSNPKLPISQPTLPLDVKCLDTLLEQFERQLDDIITKQTLEIYADPNLARIEVQRMVDRTKDLLNVVVGNFKSLIQFLNKDTVIDRRVEYATQKYSSMITGVIQKHNSHYKRCKRFSQDGLTRPVPVIVGSAMEEKCKNNQIVKELTPRKSYFIPSKSTFKSFFEKPGVLKTVLNYMHALSNNTSVLSNLIQGESWREKMRKYYLNKVVIPFLMYIDEFDVNHPLGSHKGIQKLCGVYCSILTLPPEFRICKVINMLTQSDAKEREDSLRLPENYQKDLEEGYSHSGLKEYCILNDIDNYHIYVNPYFDILHDISEGDLKFALVEILYYFIIDIKTLDFDIFNDHLKTFNYTGNGFSNKPPPFLKGDVKNKKFSLTASETTTLYLIFRFLIGDQIDLGDEVWQFYLVLREILDLIQARDIQIECTYLIDSLIETHHEMFVRLFERSLRPKQHNAVHYGSSIRKGGPMSPINTRRYEANHKFFKTAADSTSSRKEIGYTLSLKNQFNFHYHMKYGDGLSSKLETGRLSPIPTYLVGNFPSLTEDSHQCSWVKFRGLQYSPGTCVVVKLDKDDTPIFGCIDSIFIDKDKHVSLLCTMLRTEYFDVDSHAYQVDWFSNHELIDKIDNLFSPFPTIIHKMSNDCLYVAPKHAL
ncbi:hypothetical protein QAD02_017104 [Eretmocerus hayati]|uniref:Uncharacterized protein n=1 Tax=Eretmocerus hayati TaxID=131215 RepID=A0ACC2PCY7_9HYME|nr:hypothetical protein QAD02_017104 [Eretmocerus hayati]